MRETLKTGMKGPRIDMFKDKRSYISKCPSVVKYL